jgi:GMP synthase (glutamine-hydrolysing)
MLSFSPISLSGDAQSLFTQASERFDGLIILGGPQDAWDETRFPYLASELLLIRAFAARRRPVLGICLGAQLMARAFGGRVFRHPAGPEWGFQPLIWSAQGKTDPLLNPAPLAGSEPTCQLYHMQSHYDTLTLPPSGIHLASTSHSAQQAFVVDEMHYGLQFHPEVELPIAELWRQEYVQRHGAANYGTAYHLIDDYAQYGAQARSWTQGFAARWVALLQGRLAVEKKTEISHIAAPTPQERQSA